MISPVYACLKLGALRLPPLLHGRVPGFGFCQRSHVGRNSPKRKCCWGLILLAIIHVSCKLRFFEASGPRKSAFLYENDAFGDG